MSKIAIVSFAVVLLGSSAALAQPYGYPPYGYAPGSCPLPNVNYIIDPATGQTITQTQYTARYPWTNSATWTYDCASNLWTDHTAQPNPGYYAPQAQYDGGDRERGREEGRDRERERDRGDRDRDER